MENRGPKSSFHIEVKIRLSFEDIKSVNLRIFGMEAQTTSIPIIKLRVTKNSKGIKGLKSISIFKTST